MFFRFCSPVDYPENEWPAVWRIEVALQALFLVLSDFDELSDLAEESEEDTVLLVSDGIRETSFASIISAGVTEQWIDTFIRLHTPHILTFVRECRGLSGVDVAQRLHPR